MAIDYFPLEINVSQIVGSAVKRARLLIATNLPEGTPLAYGDEIAVPGGIYALPGGVGEVTLPTQTGVTNLDGDTLQYIVTGEYSVDGAVKLLDPIYIDAPTSTAAVNLASFIGVTSVPPTFMGAAVAQLQAKVDEAEAARDATLAAKDYIDGVLITDLGTTDGQTKALIEAGASETRAALNAAIGSEVAAAAYIDFTTKPDGLAPAALDSGQTTLATFAPIGRRAAIKDGRLVADTDHIAPTSGQWATYYQADVGSDVSRIGCEWTQPAGADDGNGVMALVAWEEAYANNVMNIPQSRCHFTIRPGTGVTGAWAFGVFAGGGAPYVVAKEGAYANPPADGETRWLLDVVFDEPTQTAYVTLPDLQVVTVTAAEVAAAFTAAGQLAAPAFMDLGASTVCIEQFAVTAGNVAKLPEFTGMWAETEKVRDDRKTVTPLRVAKIAKQLQPSPALTYTRLAPTSVGSAATTTSDTAVAGATVSGYFGKTGKCLIELDVYYEFTGTDTVFGRMVGTVYSSDIEAVVRGDSGKKAHVHHTFVASGPAGKNETWTYRHWAITGGLATAKWGGSAGAMTPTLVLKATPL